MELKLKYTEHAAHAISAAFIRGNDPAMWLNEINDWNVSADQLTCFIISKNNQPGNAAGLFVIFNREQLPNALHITHPYGVMAGKLFLPINAEVTPLVSEQELQSLLIWDYQVFHPSLGFVGFEKNDRISLPDLLQYTEPLDEDWSYANPGLQPWIRLHQVRIQQLNTEELFQSIKGSVGNKPLSDIPKPTNSDDSLLKKLGKDVLSGILKTGLSVFGGLGSLMAGSGAGFGSGAGKISGDGANESSGSGLFSRAMKWMEQKLHDLQQQRDNELKRLSKLFEENSDEALQYAIPLNSPYHSRGTGAPSGQLTRRSLNFNLNKLGGGVAVDGWNVDNYYDDLRSKYLKAAQKAIQEKDYKKAAYVYAHLLGDFSSAAATLKKGNYYREAALLYKEHLNNKAAAAECFEEGGLLTEAIELYTSLNRYEKAGDLYTLLERHETALTCYEKCAEEAAANRDYLEVSRIVANKIGDKQRAKQTLLKGWKDVKQPERCLETYFDMIADEKGDYLHNHIKAFYADETLCTKKLGFLHVLDNVNKKHKSEELENTCKEIALEVVSEQASAGNTASLHLLKNFIPGDSLLTPDCNRFIYQTKYTPKPKPLATKVQLAKDIGWQQAFTWRNELLVWSVQPTGLHLARINWEGHVDYYSWNVAMDPNKRILIATDAVNSNHILLYAGNTSLTSKSLTVNNYFTNEILIYRPACLPVNMIGLALKKDMIVTVHIEHNEAFINHYSYLGDLKQSHKCNFNDASYEFFYPAEPIEMIYADGHYYISYENVVLRISEQGAAEVINYENEMIDKVALNKQSDLLAASLTRSGKCVLFKVPEKDQKTDILSEINNVDGIDVCFISSGDFVITEKQRVLIYNVTDVASPSVFWELETDSDVVAVFQGPLRNQLGILDTNGLITLHNTKLEE